MAFGIFGNMNVLSKNNIKALSAKTEVKTNEKTNTKANKTQNEEDEKVSFSLSEYLDSGILKPKKMWFFNTGDYEYKADGKKTYKEIKEELGLEDGALRNSNYKIFDEIKGNADDVVPKKGTKLTIRANDLPAEEVTFKDDDGNEMDGFYKNANGEVYYEIQYGDTETSVNKKMASKSLKYYKTETIFEDQYTNPTLYEGHKITLHKKGFFGRLWASIFG
ncbi:MAG: hypothetical protein E7Z91_05070 [Cyanobacteria bacterium SIG30]|nr:hypothetical protein [Cyanobacteria bacterium SIG30]